MTTLSMREALDQYGSKKPVYWNEVDFLPANCLVSGLKAAKSFTRKEVFGKEDAEVNHTFAPSFVALPPPQCFVIWADAGVGYLINTEGYSEARYVLRIEARQLV